MRQSCAGVTSYFRAREMHTAGGRCVCFVIDRHDDLLDMTYCGLGALREI